MKKLIILVISSIFALVIGYFVISFFFINKVETYYGVISSDNRTVENLISKDGSIEDYELQPKANYKSGDYVRVKTTEVNRTIIEEKEISKDKIPKSLKAYIKNSSQ
ncbi:hypothetical protein [Mammaliicoccus sciuri]|uniref:hypothetical protein n=1 Tax=Mammaliicoccus sciuri TaxID=1296 RepID=UPI000E67D947|nr:hypothetical protein [Mammaliicoccus sciuri]RIN98320.1 hypothetical protein BU000_07215 [Mammaliicoccus sciuri]